MATSGGSDKDKKICCVPDKKNVSYGSISNERYSLDTTDPFSDHENEDELMMYSNKYSLCMCVFDGHDGSNTVRFVKKYINHQVFDKPKWDTETKSTKSEDIEKALVECIQGADENFFKSIDPFISERQELQSKIPKELNSYQAQQMFPAEVARLQKLESYISGGCTAVMAVLTSSRLYVANVGDSRAILVCKDERGSPLVKQLSKDHDVENEEEVERLTGLGLDRDQLKKSGRLGTQENTRSIGDYILKGGYKDMDVLCNATDEPGSSIPYVTSVTTDHCTFQYLILMSDGVYKALEAIDGGDTKKSGNELLVEMIKEHVTKKGLKNLAISVLQTIRQTQYELYQLTASEDVRSAIAIANRKRDDMTLMIYKFDSTI